MISCAGHAGDRKVYSRMKILKIPVLLDKSAVKWYKSKAMRE